MRERALAFAREHQGATGRVMGMIEEKVTTEAVQKSGGEER
jgi:hypothetical protein